eukprot:4342508-Amphidinium_carterae.1
MFVELLCTVPPLVMKRNSCWDWLGALTAASNDFPCGLESLVTGISNRDRADTGTVGTDAARFTIGALCDTTVAAGSSGCTTASCCHVSSTSSGAKARGT